MSGQLALPFSSSQYQLFDNFLVGGNQELVAHLKDVTLNQTRETAITFVTAESGNGKSHLLNACCNLAQENGLTAAYVDLDSTDKLAPQMMEGLEQFNVICIDNIDAILLNRDWEVAVFDLINRVLEAGAAHIVMTAQKMPKLMSFRLPDLASRLVWGQCISVKPLEEHERLLLLKTMANNAGLELSDELAHYLITRLPRDLHSLTRAMKTLDEASLQAKRKLTIPFAKDALNIEN